ncbi:unnamed protein product [Protopolystoma xenopodis]|uniref:Uncharacterized protein n=1 Tax=Protopolystoma xenopodis TaxID=117903 RepID=A0A3S5BT05_9PLAT|nr:unnamed protein product [Protopolystoma xenopodis]
MSLCPDGNRLEVPPVHIRLIVQPPASSGRRISGASAEASVYDYNRAEKDDTPIGGEDREADEDYENSPGGVGGSSVGDQEPLAWREELVNREPLIDSEFLPSAYDESDARKSFWIPDTLLTDTKAATNGEGGNNPTQVEYQVGQQEEVLLRGAEEVITHQPVPQTGIPLFPDLKFLLSSPSGKHGEVIFPLLPADTFSRSL